MAQRWKVAAEEVGSQRESGGEVESEREGGRKASVRKGCWLKLLLNAQAC